MLAEHLETLRKGEEIMGKISLADIVELPIDERIQLVEDVWDSIAAVPEAVPLTDAQRAELDRRLEAYHKNPTAGAPWEEVKARILGKS
jgi:putative addiction module component (TIGR02574 family)